MGYIGAAIATSAVLGYMGSKESSASQEDMYNRSALATVEGREWQSKESAIARDYQNIQGSLQRGYESANTDTQRKDIWNSMDANIKQEQARYDEWTEIFGDDRDNLRDYYDGLTTDSVVGKAHHMLEISYGNALTDIQNRYAERGITPKSGFHNASEMVLDISKANQSAQIMSNVEEEVLNAKMGYAQSQQDDRYLVRGNDMADFKTISENVIENASENVKNTMGVMQEKYLNNEMTADAMRDSMADLYGAEGSKYFDAVGIGDDFNYRGRDFSITGDTALGATRSTAESTGAYTGYNVNYGMRYKSGYDKSSLIDMYRDDDSIKFDDYIEEYETARVAYDNTPVFNNTADGGDAGAGNTAGDGMGGSGDGNSGAW